MNNREMCNKLNTNIKIKNYQESLNIIKDKNFYADNSSVLLKELQTGTVYYLNGDYYQALIHFESAKKISDDLYTISIKKKLAGTLDANLDNYYGEIYERSLIRFYLSLINYNIYNQGFYESYTDKTGKLIPQEMLTDEKKKFHLSYAKNMMIEWDSVLKSFKVETSGKSVYKDDMLAKLWGGFIHSEFNDSANKQIAINLYKNVDDLLLKNYNLYPTFNNKNKEFRKDFDKLPNKSLVELEKNYISETKFAKNLKQFAKRNQNNLEKNQKDNIIILLKDSLISPKEAQTIEIPLPVSSFTTQGSDVGSFIGLISSALPTILIEFPVIKNLEKINNYKAIIYNKNNDEVAETDLTMIEPLSDIAQINLEDEINLIRAETIARITAKYVAAMVAAYAIYQQGGTMAQVGAILSFKVASVAINESSRADLRYWSTLPNDYQMGGLKLKNGNYKIEIILPNDNNKKVFEKYISVKNNETTFLDLNL